MTNTFTAISEVLFNLKMDEMGFVVREMDRVNEVVFSRDIPGTRFSVVIFSTLEGGEMRDSGADAIKVTLWDNSKGRPISSKKRINRVGKEDDILNRVCARARDAWASAKDVHSCDKCDDGILVERKGKNGKFKGCSNFPSCRNTAGI
jgi:hypothetical protein